MPHTSEKFFKISNSIEFGKQAQAEAVKFLKADGYRIIRQNYRIKLGEIDIIAQNKEFTCFVEVKARSSVKYGLPCEAVCYSKQRQISKVALSYLKENHLFDKCSRFDVVSLLRKEGYWEINLIKNAFELDARFTI